MCTPIWSVRSGILFVFPTVLEELSGVVASWGVMLMGSSCHLKDAGDSRYIYIYIFFLVPIWLKARFNIVRNIDQSHWVCLGCSIFICTVLDFVIFVSAIQKLPMYLPVASLVQVSRCHISKITKAWNPSETCSHFLARSVPFTCLMMPCLRIKFRPSIR